ncbi:MAG: pilus assembly protein [Phenylobacterium sp.]|uniref:TadE/TadG family type IV pilus assembly protein n=1 Tax=Phenylobacterium sp. TaxID=1871053 RepID=UPI0027332AA5|nr:TadE/TadG family type IV pilus assembly protein [Phenylobacterium sp.]MDP3173181.1 pilus assembly protein [Phenylobacterium sp.]
MNRLRRFILDTTATSGVEFALILPLMSVLMFGFYEAGRLFWAYNIVSSASRDAARFAARLPMTCAGLSAPDVERVQRLARTGTVSGSGAPLVTGWTSDATVQVAVSCVSNSAGTYKGRYADVLNIPTVRVTASAPYAVAFGGLLPSLNITSVSVDNAQAWTE